MKNLIRRSMHFYQKYKRFNDLQKKLNLRPDEWCFISPHGIGDTYYLCALSEQVLIHNGGTSISLVVRESHTDVAALFSKNIKHVFVVKDLTPTYFFQRYDFRPGVPYIAHPFQARIGSLLIKMLKDKHERKIYSKVINLLDAYRIILNIPLDSNLLLEPSVNLEDREKAILRCHSMGLPQGRTVILFPEALSVPMLSKESWRSLSQELKRNGWTVCTTAMDPANIIPATTHINFSLRELIPAIEYCGWFISIRSGVCDLVISANCRKTVFYPFDCVNSSLVQMGFNDFEEYDLKNDNFDYLIKKIIYGVD